MAVRLQIIRESGALVFERTCEKCGKPASFGSECDYRLALLALDAGRKEEAKRLLGKGWCGEHRPK